MPKSKVRRPSTTHAVLNHIEKLVVQNDKPEDVDANTKLKRWIYLMRKRLRFQSQIRRYYVKLKRKEPKQ